MQIDKVLSVAIILLTCLLYSFIHYELYRDFFLINEYRPILVIENLSTSILPVIFYFFVLITSNIIFYFFDLGVSLKKSFTSLGVAFIVPLGITCLVYLGLPDVVSLRNINYVTDLVKIKTKFGVKFSDIKYLIFASYFASVLIYNYLLVKNSVKGKLKLTFAIWIPLVVAISTYLILN